MLKLALSGALLALLAVGTSCGESSSVSSEPPAELAAPAASSISPPADRSDVAEVVAADVNGANSVGDSEPSQSAQPPAVAAVETARVGIEASIQESVSVYVSRAEKRPADAESAKTILPASVTAPVSVVKEDSESAAVEDGPIVKTIYIDITWDENFKYIFEFDGPLTVPAGKKVRFVVTNTFTDPDECW